MFLYFLPNHARGGVTRADFEALGLAYALGAGDPDARRVTANGPEGLAGFVATVEPPPGAPAECRVDTLYEPAKQLWRKGPAGKYWVGHYKDRRPTPRGLARAKLISGEWTTLRGEHDWLVPVAKSVVRPTTLPQVMVLGEDFTTWESHDLDEYRGLTQAAERVWAILRSGTQGEDGRFRYEIEYAEGMSIVALALATNYRVSALELSMVGLTNGDMWSVLRAICDVPLTERMMTEVRQRKDEGAGTPGAAADAPPAEPAGV